MVILLTTLGSLLYFAFFSSYFNIEIIEVKGVYSLEPSLVEEIADVKFGSNLFLQNNWSKENAIKKEYSIIDNVKIKQELPNKVIIEITEKKPELVLLNNDNYVFLDSKGEVLNINDKLNQSTAPILTGIELLGTIKEGQVLVKKEIRAALQFIVKVPEDKQYLIKEIRVDDYGVAIYPTGSYKVMVGENSDVLKKIRTLETLLRDSALLGNTIYYIDISNPDKIILKTKEGIS
ncbi:MAG: FtsQ-type POTRA domain-containing protein [Firmicutes bacterium]|nr:FtsQ-type POTRA domain-containing protein [Bacillota bacterium]